MERLKLKSTILAALISALSMSSLSSPSPVVGQSDKPQGEIIVFGNDKNSTFYDKIKGKASVGTPRLIGGKMWDYPKEGEFIPVVARPIDVGDGWKYNPLVAILPYDAGLGSNNSASSPPLPPEKVAYARYNTQRLPRDMRGKVAGGRIPVINYRFARLINGYRCELLESFTPRDWDLVNFTDPSKVVDPILNVLGYELPEVDTLNRCAMQGALDAAVALVRFAPSLYSPKEYHESQALYEEAADYARNGLASSADAILAYRRKKIVPVRHFYNRKDSPLYFIVSAYPHMRRVVPTESYTPDSPPFPLIPRMTFYFFPVSPSGEVCYFQNATKFAKQKPVPEQLYFKYGETYHGVSSEDDTALEALGLTGVHCVSLSHSWADDYITVRVAFKDGRWMLDEEFSYPIRMHVMNAPEPYRIYQEPFAWIGRLRDYKGWPVAPSVHPLDGLIRFYPPFVRWLEKIERGERHVVGDAELSLTLFPYSFAPGYTLAPADPNRLAQDFTRPISLTLPEAALACQGLICEGLYSNEHKAKVTMLRRSSRAVSWFVPRYEVNAKIEYTRTDSGSGVIYIGEDYVISLRRSAAGAWRGGTLADYATGRVYALSVAPSSGKVTACRMERVSSDNYAPFAMLPLHNAYIPREEDPALTRLLEEIYVTWGSKETRRFSVNSRVLIKRGVKAEGVKEMCDAEGDKRVAALLAANADAFPGLVGEQGQLVDWNPRTRRAVVFVSGAKAEQVVKAYEESAKAINPKAAKPFSQALPAYPDEKRWEGMALLKSGRSRAVSVHEYARIHRDGKAENGAFVIVQL